MCLQLWKLRKFALQSPDVSFYQDKNRCNSFGNFRWVRQQTFKWSSAVQNRYPIFFLLQSLSKDTWISILLFFVLLELVPPTSEMKNTCSIIHCKFVGIDERYVADSTQISLGCTFMLASGRYLKRFHVIKHCSVPNHCYKNSRTIFDWGFDYKKCWRVSWIGFACLKNVFTEQ